MSKTGQPQDPLQAAFDAARARPPEPDADFLARVLADAEAVQAEFADIARPAPVSGPRGWRGVFAALGGWPAAVGLTAAMVTGIWIGVAPPAPLSAAAQDVLGGAVTLAFEPDMGTDLFPGEEG